MIRKRLSALHHGFITWTERHAAECGEHTMERMSTRLFLGTLIQRFFRNYKDQAAIDRIKEVAVAAHVKKSLKEASRHGVACTAAPIVALRSES